MFRSKKENEQEKKSRLEGLQERLYSQNNPSVFRDKRSGFHTEGNQENVNWQEFENDEKVQPEVAEVPSAHTFSKVSHIILYAAIALFLGAVAFTVYHFVWGSSRPTPDKISLVVRAPSFINGGEVFPIDIDITNLNKSAIQKVDLIVEYPKGESITEQSSADRVRIPVGDIASGATGRGTTDIVLYGRESNLRDIRVSLEYYAPGSYVILKKNITHTLTLKAAPVVLTTEHFKEVSSNQELTYKVRINAERGIDIKNFLLNIDYPNGFQFVSADPAPRYSNNLWSFDLIEKGKVQDVTVRGIVRGEDGDEKAFRVSGGSPDLIDSNKIGIVYADTRSFVVVQKPFIGLTGAFEGTQNTTGEFAIRAGERTNGSFTYQNNIGDTISNVIVKAKISGEILDRRRVNVPNGYYDSSSNTLVWNRTTEPGLASLLPGASGVLKFQIQTYPLGAKQNGYFSQPSVVLEAKVTGQRTSDTKVPEVSSASSPLVAKVITEAGIRADVLPENKDSGVALTAPVKEKNNIYTLAITILNRSNSLKDSEVSITLAPNVTYLSSDAEGVTADQNTNTVVWRSGTVLPDTGFGKPAKTVYIKISVVPSVTDVGTKQFISSGANLKGLDEYSGITVTSGTNKIEIPLLTQ